MLTCVFICAVSVAWSLTAVASVLLTSSVHAKPAAILATSRRWEYPCAGSVLVEGFGDDVVMMSAENQPNALQQRLEDRSEKTKGHSAEPVDWRSTLRTLSERAKKLKKRARDLRRLYVSSCNYQSNTVCDAIPWRM